MRTLSSVLLTLCFSAVLGGCSQQALLEKFIPKEESEIAKRALYQVANKDFAAVEVKLDPSIRSPDTRSSLEQVADLFPPEDAKSITTVGAHTSTSSDVTTYNLTYELAFPDTWLLANVSLVRRDGKVTIIGLHVNKMEQSLGELNRFSLSGKGALHYTVLALAIAIPIFIVTMLVVCFRTPIAKRKWLWLIFIAFGFVGLSLNWTDGSYSIEPVSFALLGAGFFSTGPYAPVIINIAFPLGAIVFYFRRRSFGAANAG